MEDEESRTARRRQQNAERSKKYRQRQKAARLTQAQSTEQQPCVIQRIISYVPVESEEASRTSDELGLRVEGIGLPEDHDDARLKRTVTDLEEPDVVTRRNLQQDDLPSFATPEPELCQPSHAETVENGSAREAASTEEHCRVPNFDPDLLPNTSCPEAAKDINDEDKEQAFRSAREYTLEKLVKQLTDGCYGCSSAKHEIDLDRHNRVASGNHHGLNELFTDAAFPSVLHLSGSSHANLAGVPDPTPAQWRATFSGIAPSVNSQPQNVCLHQESTQPVESQVRFDIDSFLGFASSLAMAREGIRYQAVPQMLQNLKSDVHIKMDVFHTSPDSRMPEQRSSRMLRDVPHLFLGYVVGTHNVAILVLFPHMTFDHDRFIALTNHQLQRWLDEVFHPAVHRYVEAGYSQHLPGDFRHALANARAHQVEARQVETVSYQAQRSITYHLQPEHLGLIWEEILSTTSRRPGLADFREPQLIFNAKGTKLQFMSDSLRPALVDAMDKFQTYLDRIIDLNFVQLDRLYVDIGKEICPSVSSTSQSMTERAGPQVYSWKRCCLEEHMNWMYDGQPPKSGTRGQRYYQQHMLRDACALTSVPPMRSKLAKGGLVYSQFYASVKEVWDATKLFPFENDGLEELALDPEILKGAKNLAGGHRRDAKVIERAYNASKLRTHSAILASKNKSFGIREEHRITWSLFRDISAFFRCSPEERHCSALECCPTYAWSFQTGIYLGFIWRSVNKFASGFELTRRSCHADFVTWEQTKMLAMFLRCLRFIFGSNQVDRESALWWSRRDRTMDETGRTRTWYGLGFENTLLKYGYCWLEPRFDWVCLQFQPDITHRVLFGNAVLRNQYLKRGGQLQAFFDLTCRMDLSLSFLAHHGDRDQVRRRLIEWMVHICLEQFRKDIMYTVRHDISADHKTQALEGKQAFCSAYFQQIMTHSLCLVAGNRCAWKQVSALASFLFEFDDERERRGWENRAYRKLFQRALARLGEQLNGAEMKKEFFQRLIHNLVAYHWILPYPSTTGLSPTNDGKRLWYSLVQSAEESHPLTERWTWGRKLTQFGTPAPFPAWVEWTREEWEQWIELPRGIDTPVSESNMGRDLAIVRGSQHTADQFEPRSGLLRWMSIAYPADVSHTSAVRSSNGVGPATPAHAAREDLSLLPRAPHQLYLHLQPNKLSGLSAVASPYVAWPHGDRSARTASKDPTASFHGEAMSTFPISGLNLGFQDKTQGVRGRPRKYATREDKAKADVDRRRAKRRRLAAERRALVFDAFYRSHQ